MSTTASVLKKGGSVSEVDATYYQRRAFEEHEAAARALNPIAARAHEVLAAKYTQLAEREINSISAKPIDHYVR
jgi:hypothetical protein